MIEERLLRVISLIPQTFGNYKESSNTYKFIKPIIREINELIEAANDVRDTFDIDLAEGVHLDLRGRDAGVPRAGRNDQNYRTAIKVQITADKSSGEIEVIRDVAALIFNRDIGLSEMYNSAEYSNEPAGIIMEIEVAMDNINITDPSINRAVSGGVRLATQLRNTLEIIEVQEPVASVLGLIQLRTGTFTIAKNLGNLF